MSESDTADPDIMRGEDAPGAWRHRTVGGGFITWTLPVGVSIDGFDPDDDQCVEMALEKEGDYGDDHRPVDVWVVTYNPDRIIQNYRDRGESIGRASDMEEAAKVAVEFMKANPGDGEPP